MDNNNNNANDLRINRDGNYNPNAYYNQNGYNDPSGNNNNGYYYGNNGYYNNDSANGYYNTNSDNNHTSDSLFDRHNGFYDSNAYDNNLNEVSSEYLNGPVAAKRAFDFKIAEFSDTLKKAYLFMVIGLLITAFSAFTVSQDTLIIIFSDPKYFFTLLFSEIAIVLVSNWAVKKNNAILAGALFTAYAYLTGLTFGVIFMLYTASSVASVFLITAGLFLVMTILGYVTKMDLSKTGSVLFMGLFGVILAGFVNLFILKSDLFDTIICVITVLIFTGLVAYDTQKMKKRIYYSENYSQEDTTITTALTCAFEIYLDFINIFLRLIRILGKRK